MRLITHHFRMKEGTARDVYDIIKDGTPVTYYELSLATGKTRNQLARAIKYLRSEGHLISTINRAGRYAATLTYKGKE